MDNYERTAELVEIAADSAGKADEQFAKYSDTIEYKLNQLLTKWEQFTVTIMNSDIFKSILDLVNQVVDRLANIDFSKTLKIAPFLIFVVKDIIKTIKDEFKSSSRNVKVIKDSIKSVVSDISDKTKIKISVDTHEVEEKIKEIDEKIKSLKLVDLGELKIDTKNISPEEYLDAYIKKVKQEEDRDINRKVASNELAQKMNIENLSKSEQNKEIKQRLDLLRQYKIEQKDLADQLDELLKKEKRQNALFLAGNAALADIKPVLEGMVLAFSAYTSGALTASEATKMFAIEMAQTVTTNLLNAGLTVAASAAKAIAAKTEEQAWWDVAKAELAAFAPVSLLSAAFLAIIGTIAAVTSVLLNYEERIDDASNATIQLARAQEDLSRAEVAQNTTKSDIKSLTQEKETIEQLKEDYELLSKKKVKTAEDTERLNELRDNIKENYEEIIKIEDKENDMLFLFNSNEDVKLKYLDEEIKKRKELLSIQNAELFRAQTSVDDYSALSNIASSLGINISVLNQKNGDSEAAIFKRLLSGNLKYEDNDITFQERIDADSGETYQVINTAGQWLSDFSKKLTEGQENYINSTEEERAKLLEAWDYVITGQGAVAEDYLAAALEMRKAVDEATELLYHFDDYYNLALERTKEQYKDETDIEQSLRAIFKASQMGETKEYSEIEIPKALGSDNVGAFGGVAERLGFNLEDDKNIDEIVKLYEKIYFEVKKGVGRADYQKLIASSTPQTLKELKNIGVTDEQSYEEIFAGIETNSEIFSKIQELLYDRLMNELLESSEGYDIPQELADRVNSIVKDIGTMPMSEAKRVWAELREEVASLVEDDQLSQDAANAIFDLASVQYSDTQLAEMENTIKNVYKHISDETTPEAQEMLINSYQKAINSTGSEELAKQLSNKWVEVLQQSDIKFEDWAAYLQIDWSQLSDPIAAKEFKESQIKLMKEQGYANAEAVISEMMNYAEQYGALDITIDTDIELDKYLEALDEIQTKVEKLGDSIINSVSDMTKNGQVSFKTFQSAIKDLQEVGLDAYKYYDIDPNGKITINAEKLKSLYEDQLKAGKLELIQERDKTQLKLAELETQINITEAIIAQIKPGTTMLDLGYAELDVLREKLDYQLAIAKLISKQSGQSFSEQDFVINPSVQIDPNKVSETKQAMESYLKSLVGQRDATKNLLENFDAQIENYDKYTNAALNDFLTRFLEAQEVESDLTKTTDDYNKALKDLENAQEDVTEKQEKLNEALEEYNSLLVGSEDRKSALDYLYNYNEAIDSFNNDINKAQDLLSNIRGIEESAVALQDYAQATHNLLAEERAKQEVLKAGLKNYEDLLQNQGYQYQNAETGEVTTVNFKDYVKKDDRTNKYVIDQRLLNEARFTDKMKDYIEQQVSDYNKYSDELLKLQEQTLKDEKAIQEERKKALKNYTSLEKDIADALKDAYEQEVEDLKDKYSDMKDADDDYIDALQDAIDRQRRLRDTERGYEELAEKEKRLSLMQRDTSGANIVETKDLEKEIQEDRESLLDDAVDNIIDGLSKLYESQQELLDEEIELKEALIDNTAFWNSQAQELAMSFTSADEYISFMAELSTDFSDLTFAQQQERLNEYEEAYAAASEYMAMTALDNISSTGDFILETIQTNENEILNIITETSEVFTTEAQRAYNETATAFQEDMKKAQDAIADARDALQEAIEKLNECALAADKAAAAYSQAQSINSSTGIVNSVINGGQSTSTSNTINSSVKSSENKQISLSQLLIDKYKMNQNAVNAIVSGTADPTKVMMSEIMRRTGEKEISVSLLKRISNETNSKSVYDFVDKILHIDHNAIEQITKGKSGDEAIKAMIPAIKAKYKFAEGGLVNFTGPAWVDGTREQPEAFLSAEDTKRIGEAAKILANLPFLNNSVPIENTITNAVGETHIEIHLDIDHIESEVDIDEMVNRVKDEIVDAIHPTGSSVFLASHI